jgi:hypothetical protein
MLAGVAASTLLIGAFPRTASGMSCPSSVAIGAVEYLGTYPGTTPFPEALVGEPIGPAPRHPQGTCNLGGCTFPDEGSQLRRAVGYEPFFRVIGSIAGRWVLFEVYRNPTATRGSDIYDIRGKVRSIEIARDSRGPKGRIERPDDVARLVDLLLAAPVVHAPRSTLEAIWTYNITIEMQDGTATSLYYESSPIGRMNFDLVPGDAFEQMLAAAVR